MLPHKTMSFPVCFFNCVTALTASPLSIVAGCHLPQGASFKVEEKAIFGILLSLSATIMSSLVAVGQKSANILYVLAPSRMVSKRFISESRSSSESFAYSDDSKNFVLRSLSAAYPSSDRNSWKINFRINDVFPKVTKFLPSGPTMCFQREILKVGYII